MKMEHLDHAIMLRNHRRKALDLRRAAESGYCTAEFKYNGDTFDVANVVPVDCVRAAVVSACNEFVREKDRELAEIGVEP